MNEKFTTLASPEAITKTMDALRERYYLPEVVATGADAFMRIKELIPSGASVMNGTSRTMEQIGLIDYFKAGQHGWNNLHDGILAEADPEKQALLRRQSVASDYYLGSVHAVAQTGEIVIASNSGSQLPHIVYTSPNLIFVVGAQKITPNFDAAMERLEKYVYPLEDARMKETGGKGSFISKMLVLNREPPSSGRKVHIIFVNEKLGF